jgi:hypothetical protein
MRAMFADSIHLARPDMSLPYSINTDASGWAIGAVMTKTTEEVETSILSTASRVLNPTEQRHSFAEQKM